MSKQALILCLAGVCAGTHLSTTCWLPLVATTASTTMQSASTSCPTTCPRPAASRRWSSSRQLSNPSSSKRSRSRSSSSRSGPSSSRSGSRVQHRWAAGSRPLCMAASQSCGFEVELLSALFATGLTLTSCMPCPSAERSHRQRWRRPPQRQPAHSECAPLQEVVRQQQQQHFPGVVLPSHLAVSSWLLSSTCPVGNPLYSTYCPHS